VIWLAWLGLAFGADFYLEAPPMGARPEAQAVLETAEVLGWDGRVLRRYRHGTGWEFVVVVEGFQDRALAEEAARALAEESGVGITVYRLEGREGVPLGETDDRQRVVPSAAMPEAEELLQRAARALGGPQGGLARLEAAPLVEVTYLREVTAEGGAVVAWHRWAGAADQRLLEIRPEGGGLGVASVSVLRPDGAWLRTGGTTSPADRERCVEVMEDLSPMARLAWPLQFAGRLEEAGPYRVARQELVQGRSTWVLVATSPTPERASRIWLDAATGRPLKVDFQTEGGRVELTLSDYREPDTGLVVPFRLEVRRDGLLIERLEITSVALSIEVPEGLFTLPQDG